MYLLIQSCTNKAVDRCVTKLTDVSSVNKNIQTKMRNESQEKIKQTGNKLQLEKDTVATSHTLYISFKS